MAVLRSDKFPLRVDFQVNGKVVSFARSRSVLRSGFGLGVAGVLAALFSTGCGGRPAVSEVSGIITFQGEKVNEGSILFAGEDGGHVTAGGDIVEGAYRIEAPLGNYRITIATPPPPPVPGPPPPGLGIPPDVIKKLTEEAIAAAKKKRVLVPPEYGSFSSTPLRYEVVKGSQSHDIVID